MNIMAMFIHESYLKLVHELFTQFRTRNETNIGLDYPRMFMNAVIQKHRKVAHGEFTNNKWDKIW